MTDIIQNVDTKNINANKSHQPVCQPVRVDAKSTEEGHDHDADRAIEDVLLCVLRHDTVPRYQPICNKECWNKFDKKRKPLDTNKTHTNFKSIPAKKPIEVCVICTHFMLSTT